MKYVFFATAILTTSFSYGMKKEIQITDVPVLWRPLNQIEEKKTLKESPRKEYLSLKSLPDLTRTRKLSQENPNFVAEENMGDFLKRRDSDKK